MTLLLLLNSSAVFVPGAGIALQIGNRGTGPLNVGTVSIVPDNGTTAFTITADAVSGSRIDPGVTRGISVAFAPFEDGLHTATLRIPSSDPDGVLLIPLSGQGADLSPVISVDPLTWDFGSVAGPGRSPQAAFSVANTGNGPLTVGTIVLSGSSFTQIGDSASGAVIPAGQARSYSVSFTPSTTGAKTGTITIPSDGGADVVVALSGTGTRTVTLLPSAWNAGTVQVTGIPATITAVVRSTGTVPVTIATATVSAGQGFSKTTDNASGHTIDPGDQLGIVVTFAPSSTGAKTGTLSVPSNTTTQVMPLSGTGTSIPVAPTPPPAPEDNTYELVSRFYLGRNAAPISIVYPPELPGVGWQRQTSDADNALTVIRHGVGPTYGSPLNHTGVSGDRLRLARFISDPLAAQTIATTFSAWVTNAIRADVLGWTVTSVLRFGLWRDPAGPVDWFPMQMASSAVEAWSYPAAPRVRDFPAVPPPALGAITPTMTVLAGDRLIVELGARAFSTATSYVRMQWGGANSQSDLAKVVGDQDDHLASFIDFTNPLRVLV